MLKWYVTQQDKTRGDRICSKESISVIIQILKILLNTIHTSVKTSDKKKMLFC